LKTSGVSSLPLSEGSLVLTGGGWKSFLPDVRIDQAEFRERDYLPFSAAIEADVDMIMVTHALIPALDPINLATFSKPVIGDELRGYLGYDGLIITDDLQMDAVKGNFSLARAIELSLLAGCDLPLFAEARETVSELVEVLTRAADENEALAVRIAESARHVAEFKEDKDRFIAAGAAPAYQADQSESS
jgi:beta-N-acetylhexosaminidase